MPATLSNGDILKIRQVTFFRGQLGINVLFYRVSNMVGSMKDGPLVVAVDSAWSAQMKPCLNQKALYRGVGLQRVQPNPVTEVVSVVNAGNGTGGADAAEPQMAAIITKRTGLTGRKNRGRVYVPFHALQDIDPVLGTPTAGYQVNLGTWAAQVLFTNNYVDGVNSCDLIPVLAHRLATSPVTYTTIDITSVDLQPKFGGQHRRGDYGKPNVLPF